ncbi:MAG: hypothetical protein ACO1SX_17945 [Actinomycetota bacterium]
MAALLPPDVSLLSPGLPEVLDPAGSRFSGRTPTRANRRIQPPPRKRPYAAYLPLAAILLLAVLVRCLWLEFQLDDSFITYTFARSLARGEGFSFTGTQVLGTTSPLYALVLSLFQRLGVPVELAAKGLGMASALAGCTLLYRLTQAELGRGGALLAAALLALNGVHASISMSGMETSLYTTVCLAALYLQGRRPYLTALLAACACLLRPDGLLLAGILALVHLSERRPWRLAPVLCFGVPLLVWVANAGLLFRSPLPSSLAAKLAYPAYGPFSLAAALRAVGPHLGWGLLLCGGLAIGEVRRRHQRLLPLVAWTALYLLAFLRAPNFTWYYVPVLPGLIVLGVAGLCTLGRHLMTWAANRGPRERKLVVAVQVLAAASVLSVAAVDLRDQREFLDRTHGPEVSGTYRAIARWLRSSTPPDARVGIPEVGYVGFYSGRRVLDLAGLCSPEVIPYLRKRAYEAVVQDFQPEYVVLTTERHRPVHNAIGSSAWFLAHYAECVRFPYRGNAYVIWRRRDAQ